MTDRVDEEIVAYLDGEMPEQAVHAFEARMRADPALADAVAGHQEALARLRRAYPAVPDKVFGDRELAALGLLDKASPVLSGPGRTARKGISRVWTKPIWWVAMAASLVIGIAVGQLGTREQGSFMERHGQLLASADLDKAFDGLDDGGAGPVRIGLSFRGEKELCRTFRLDSGFAGIACKSNARWTIPMLMRSDDRPPSSADFRLAAGDFPPSVMREVDSRIAGAPLTPAEVDRARRNGWR